MRLASILPTLLLALAACGLAPRANAQLPTATGRHFNLSNAAWKLFIPSTYQHRAGEATDVVVHFHGDPQTFRNNAAYAKLNTVVLTINYSGLSSAYSTPFSNATSPTLFQSVMDEALGKVRAEADFADTAAWDHIAVSSFSAGYGAVREILKNATYRNAIDSLLAADSLYATTAGDGTPLDSQMVDYKSFAALAKNGQKTFIYSHSQVPTYTYETTGECGDELLQSLGITASAINQPGLGTLTFNRHATSGNFELWGATGADAAAHSKHLQYIGDFLEDLPIAKLTNFAADFNKDGQVNSTDLATWRNAFGSTAAGDTNADGKTDGADFLAWQRLRGSQPAATAAASAVPEPYTSLLMLATIIGAAIGSRQRYRISSPSATLIGAA